MSLTAKGGLSFLFFFKFVCMAVFSKLLFCYGKLFLLCRIYDYFPTAAQPVIIFFSLMWVFGSA
jgi:hypothetical protein